MASEPTEPVVIGSVGGAHGVRGDVYVRSLSDVPGRFDPGTEVTVGGRPRRVTSSRAHKGRLLVHFEGIDDRAAAEEIRGQDVLADPVDTSGERNYYAHDLVGMAVVLADGTWLGDVVGMQFLPDAAGYDLLDVDADGVRWQLPDADELVEVADADGTDVLLVVDPPDGLIPASLLHDGDHDQEG